MQETEYPTPYNPEFKEALVLLHQTVYETDPLVCPKCSGEIRIISFIDQAEFIMHAKRS